MTDIIVGFIIVAIVGAAIAYIRKESKRGVKCIGCPDAESCANRGKESDSGCNGNGSCNGNCSGCNGGCNSHTKI